MATGVLFALSGCAAEPECTLIGTSVGISVHVDAPLADRVSAAELTACWNGSCRTAKVELHPAGGVARQTCEGEACAAEVEPTGGKQGFGDVAGLPKAPVRVEPRLKGQGGELVVERELTVTPEGSSLTARTAALVGRRPRSPSRARAWSATGVTA